MSSQDRNTDGAGNAPPPTDNPYNFPKFLVSSHRIYNGAPVFNLPFEADPVEQVKRVRGLELRDDDIIIAAFPKCGTHWVSEILSMLVSQSTSYATQSKGTSMLEFIQDFSRLDSLPSPRVLNSHYYFAHLPEQISQKKIKIVHMIRNPKDMAVSFYHHMKQFGTDKFTFDNFIQGYTTNDFLASGHQMGYLKQMAEFEKANPDHPIMHIHYEDLKQDPLPILRSLSKFVGYPASDEFSREVIEACGFQKMKDVETERRNAAGTKVRENLRGISVFRKGIVGDWKNSLTVAQSEALDAFIERESRGLDIKFRGL